MYFSDEDPGTIPPPPTIDEVSELFTVPMMTLVPQPSLEEQGVGTAGSSSNGGPTVLDEVSISYTFWRNPDNHADPVNLAELDDATRAALDTAPERPLPDWLMAQRSQMRYPLLWEAVRTTRVIDTESQTPESILMQHVNHVLMNRFREQRVVGAFPGMVNLPVTEKHIEHVSIRVDSDAVPGMRIDSDPNVYAVGAALGDRILTSVIAREYLPFVTVAFVTL